MTYTCGVAELKLFWDYMTEHLDRIRRVVELLDRLHVRYAVIGGHAVSFHARPRLTVDVDFLVAVQKLSAIEKALTDADLAEARRIVAASNPAAADELSRLVDDVRHARKITI